MHSLIFSKNRFLFFLITGVIVFLLGAWLSSGTLCPYANTLFEPKIFGDCEYFANFDHHQFKAVFSFIDGRNREEWWFSIYFRRILFPFISFPLMKLFGFELGGIIMGILINLIVFVAFVLFIKKQIGEKAALISICLLALYPGTMYWIGLPYFHTLIVPFTLLLTIILFKLKQLNKISEGVGWGLLMGILFTGYDLIVFFGPATALLFFLNKKMRLIPLTLLAMLLPSVLLNAALFYFYEISWSNDNTNVYSTIINSYLHISDISAWMVLLLKLPIIAINHFLFGNFIFIPLGFISIIFLLLFNKIFIPFSDIEISILIPAILLFLFNEAAPPYTAEWEMRGFWIARIYQPVFIVYVLYISRVYQTLALPKVKKLVHIILIIVLLGNANIVFGQIVKSPLASYSYFLFYKHRGGYDMQIQNLNKHGVRPLGICK